MKNLVLALGLLAWASLTSGCVTAPATPMQTTLHPADARAPAAPLPSPRWRSVALEPAEAAGDAAQHADHDHAGHDHGGHDHHAHDGPAGTGDSGTVTGTITGLDREAQRLVLAHGPIPGLGMPAMEMAFDVAHPGLLEGLSQDDQVRFSVRPGEREGQFVITAIEPAADNAADHGDHGNHGDHGASQ